MIYVIIAIVVIILICIITEYNSLVESKNMVKEAFSTMDVYLKKRWDLIPNLVEIVKGYIKHEKETLEKVTELRTKSYESMSNEKKINLNEQISVGMAKLLAIAENYPELKANTNFINLSKELVNIENDLANSRKYYNGCVKKYNNQVQIIPSNIIAKIFHFKEAKMFEANSEERNNVKVEL